MLILMYKSKTATIICEIPKAALAEPLINHTFCKSRLFIVDEKWNVLSNLCGIFYLKVRLTRIISIIPVFSMQEKSILLLLCKLLG